MKYATAIAPESRKATGRVYRPSKRRAPPNASRTPAKPGSDARDAVPPPGMTAAGKANSFAVPNWMKRKAATIRSVLSRYGAHVDHRAAAFGVVKVPPRFVERGTLPGASSCTPRASAHELEDRGPQRGA